MANKLSIIEALGRVANTSKEYTLEKVPHVVNEEVIITVPASSIIKEEVDESMSAGEPYYVPITDSIPETFDMNNSYFISYNNIEYPCVFNGYEFELNREDLSFMIVIGYEVREESLVSEGFAKVKGYDNLERPFILIEKIDSTNIHDINLISKQVQYLDNMFLQKDLKISNSLSIGRLSDHIGEFSSALGKNVDAYGYASHAEGVCTITVGEGSHAEGCRTYAEGDYSHAEGYKTITSGDYSHAEGDETLAIGNYSHAEGSNTVASGDYSHAEGYNTIASSLYQHVQGQYNIRDNANEYAHIVGNGRKDNSTNWEEVRSNAHTLDWDGNAWYAGDVKANNVPHIVSESVVLTIPADTIESYKEDIDNATFNSPAEILIDDAVDISLYLSNNKEIFIKYNGNEYKFNIADGEMVVDNINCGCVLYMTPAVESGTLSNESNTLSFFIWTLDTTNITNIEIIEREIKKLDNMYIDDNLLVENSISLGIRSGEIGEGSLTNGFLNEASGYCSHAEGYLTNALGDYSHAEGASDYTFQDIIKLAEHFVPEIEPQSLNIEDDTSSVTNSTIRSGNVDEPLGRNSINNSSRNVIDEYSTNDIIDIWRAYYFSAAFGDYSHVEGVNSLALGEYSHAEGSCTIAESYCSHAEGEETIAESYCSHAEGYSTRAEGGNSHAEGVYTIAEDYCSHAEGYSTHAKGEKSHAEGKGTLASGEGSHAEGVSTVTKGDYSHAEGCFTNAKGDYSHAEGYFTNAEGDYSHAEGRSTVTKGDYSHAEGYNTIASSLYQHVQGQYNIEDAANKYAHIVGNGTSDTNRNNAYTLDWEGNAYFSGKVKQDGVPTDDNDLATKKYVDENSSNVADGFIMNDQDTGYKYLIQMKSGALTSILLPDSISVDVSSLEGVTFMEGDGIDLETLTFMANYPDGNSEQITDIENISYEPSELTTDITEISFVYNISGIKLTYDMPITVIAFDPAVKLQDFNYTTNSDGTYTLTGWKETYNGVASTELIIPNNNKIIL